MSISSRIVTPLEKTKLWARIISILGFIVGGINIFTIVGDMAHGIVDPKLFVPLGFAAVLFYFSYMAGQYANRISRFSKSLRESDLAAALKSQLAVWRLIGLFGLFAFLFVIMLIFLDIANAFV